MEESNFFGLDQDFAVESSKRPASRDNSNEALMVATRTQEYGTTGPSRKRRRKPQSSGSEDEEKSIKSKPLPKAETVMQSKSSGQTAKDPVKLPLKDSDRFDQDPLNFTIVEKYESDLFEEAPKKSVLVHACNCRGSWGGGIAKAFAQRYPKAYMRYRKHCNDFKPNQSILRGTALLIPPVDNVEKPVWIGCLFTSVGFGMNLDPPQRVLMATKTAMKDLMVAYVEAERKESSSIGDVYMCKINSGLFKVPWHRTRDILEKPDVFVKDSPQKIFLLAAGPEEPDDKRR